MPSSEDIQVRADCDPFGCKMSARASARRSRVTEAARRLFAENGFHNTGIAEIARQSGVLVGQIYRDFAHKEDIVAAIVEHDVAEFLAPEDLRAAIDRGDRAAARRWICRFIGGHAIEEPRLIAEIMAESARNPRIAAIFENKQAQLRASVYQALAMIAPPGCDHARISLLVEVVHTMSLGVLQRRLNGNLPVDEALTDALFAIVEHEIDASV